MIKAIIQRNNLDYKPSQIFHPPDNRLKNIETDLENLLSGKDTTLPDNLKMKLYRHFLIKGLKIKKNKKNYKKNKNKPVASQRQEIPSVADIVSEKKNKNKKNVDEIKLITLSNQISDLNTLINNTMLSSPHYNDKGSVKKSNSSRKRYSLRNKSSNPYI